MLRELNTHEMKMVSGGFTPPSAQRRRERELAQMGFNENEIDDIMANGGSIHGVWSRSGLAEEVGEGSPDRYSYQSGQQSFDNEGNECNTPGPDYGHSWTAYLNTLGGDRSEQRLLQGAHAARDIRNANAGCSGMDGVVNPAVRG